LLTLVPPCVLTVAVALKSVPGRAISRYASMAFLVAAIAASPSRISAAQRSARMPEYGALSRGSLAIRERTAEIADIRAGFDVPAGTHIDYMYTVVLGGRVVPATGAYIATIQHDGDVTYSANPNLR